MKRIAFADYSALIMITISCMVLTGWIFHLPTLIYMVSGYTIMVFNTALSFLIAGCALFLMSRFENQTHKIAVIAGSAIMAIALPTLLQSILKTQFGYR